MNETAPPRWALHRRLYLWVLSLAQSKHSSGALFGLSFAESSFFPIPPDLLLMPLVLGRPDRWIRLAALCSIASVLGGIAGYFIGWSVWHQIDEFVFSLHLPGLNPQNFDKVGGYFDQYSFWIVFAAGFTPIPYKVITISAGLFALSPSVASPWAFFGVFVVASALSRSARFFLVAWLCGRFGPAVLPFIDRHLGWLSIAFVVLLVAGFLVLKAF